LVRGAVVARVLTETAGLASEHVHAVGLSDTWLLDLHGIEHVNDHVLISIKQGIHNGTE
jgi:hypothetical protein